MVNDRESDRCPVHLGDPADGSTLARNGTLGATTICLEGLSPFRFHFCIGIVVSVYNSSLGLRGPVPE